ncbi:hypothetical protein IGI04_001916 [Brassica rapa subsp. trilocularis]|uniref:Uncharacterized protein n=1 Tax=Brassica rapa subsp. trilocularis TaxID=1813537 RepID=A0ABQ7NTZ8_BRACM|nr:hypothetical protein IGI04_001916 [Brassica rapa subsp. trilocularis]
MEGSGVWPARERPCRRRSPSRSRRKSSPAFPTRSPSFALLELWSGPCPSSIPRRVLRHHRWCCGWSNDAIGWGSV